MSIMVETFQQLLRATRADSNDELLKMKRKEPLKYRQLCISIANGNSQRNKLQVPVPPAIVVRTHDHKALPRGATR